MPLVECPSCSHEVSDTAPSCPQCGHVLKKKAGCGQGCLVAAVVVVACGILNRVVIEPFFPSLGVARHHEHEQPTESTASVMSREYVRAFLKSPATASFPWLDTKVDDLGNGRFMVSSY